VERVCGIINESNASSWPSPKSAGAVAASATDGLSRASRAKVLSMLMAFHWDTKALIEEYLDDPFRLKQSLGLAVDPTKPTLLRFDRFPVLMDQQPKHAAAGGDALVGKAGASAEGSILGAGMEVPDCCLCMGPQNSDNAFALQCGHFYCGDCWSQYIRAKVSEFKEIRCPCEEKCPMIATEEIIAFLCDEEVTEMYHQNVRKSFIEDRQGGTRFSYCKNPAGKYVMLNVW
jgi:ariadne-1